METGEREGRGPREAWMGRRGACGREWSLHNRCQRLKQLLKWLYPRLGDWVLMAHRPVQDQGPCTWSAPFPTVTGLFLQDPFPKGVIPLTAIEMARSSKDNKFQIITGQRVFVFRTESEGERPARQVRARGREPEGTHSPLTHRPVPHPPAQRDTWCSTLQSCLKELHLLGSPRPPQLPRPLRTGMLELRGHKAKVFAALSPGELALYKSEQVRRAGRRLWGLAWSVLAPHAPTSPGLLSGHWDLLH